MKNLAVTFMILFFMTTSCQETENINDENRTIELDQKSALLIEADNAFGLDIFRKIRKESKEENIMVSPLSISVALAMAYNGAEGDTKSEMRDALKLNGLTPEEINSSYKMLIDALQSLDREVVFELANAIYYRNGFSVKPGFLEINETIYDAEVSELDFSSPEAIAEINSWVAEKTHDKIRKIIEQLSAESRMVLLNAIYFNGIWSVEFDNESTKMRSFYYNGGTTDEVPMMRKEDALEYMSNSLFSAVKLPYGTGKYNMIVMLPGGDNNSQDLIDQLNRENWENWDSDFVLQEKVQVTMPRFKFAFETELNEVLKQMGMQKAFQPNIADFSGISDIDLFISAIKHKSFIDVNETGTEAAAVTSIVFETTSIDPEEKIYFSVNKPFVFAITEKDTGAILFIGEVQNPEYTD